VSPEVLRISPALHKSLSSVNYPRREATGASECSPGVVNDFTRSVKASTPVKKAVTRSVKDPTRDAKISTRIAKSPTIQPGMSKLRESARVDVRK